MEKRNAEQEQNSTIEILLNEFIEKQHQQTQSIKDLTASNNRLQSKVVELEEKLKTPPVVNVSTDTQPVQEIVKKAVTDMKLIAAAQPKSIVKKFQILLFPEQDAKLFYKIVFGRWFMWLVIALFLSLSYEWMIHREDNNKQMIMEAWKNDKIIKAWDYLHSQNNKTLHRLMDSALKKSDVPSK